MQSDEFVTSSDLRIGYIKPVGQPWRSVVYAAVDGMAIFEGCIVLGTVAEMEEVGALVREHPQILSEANAEEGVGIKGEQFRWPGKRVFYEIDHALPKRSRVQDAIRHWEEKTDFKFIQRTSEPNYIVFGPGSGCSSSVGMRGGPQKITLGPNCTSGNAIHEIGHAVGLWHEQSRGDRDNFIEIVWQNIDPLARHNFEQHIDDGVDIAKYDYQSIMHYPATAFSVNGLPTIRPRQTGVAIGQRNGLSAGDIAAVKKLYS